MDKRDKKLAKKRLGRIALTVAAALAVLALIAALAPLVLDLIGDGDDTSRGSAFFYEPDYSRDIADEPGYKGMSADKRAVHYNRFGYEYVLNETNVSDLPPSAVFFADYFDCLLRGDAEHYRTLFTEECINGGYELPERFTTQGVYDINVSLFRSEQQSIGGVDTGVEVFEVSYRIYQNDATFRSDILPDETRTLVFELHTVGGEVKINAIGYRKNA